MYEAYTNDYIEWKNTVMVIDITLLPNNYVRTEFIFCIFIILQYLTFIEIVVLYSK